MNYTISFICGEHYTQYTVAEKSEITIGSSKKDNIFCNEFKSEQITIKNKSGKLSIDTKSPLTFEKKNITHSGMFVVDEKTRAVIYVDFEKTNNPNGIELPRNAVVSVGRSSKNDIVYSSLYVSGVHFLIRRENGIYYIEDKNSTNGTFVNGLRASKLKLESGDRVNFINYTIELKSGKLYFGNVGKDMMIQRLPSDKGNVKESAYNQGERPVYRRSPRTQEEMPKENIVLAAPPSKGQKYEKGHGMLNSMVGSAAMFGSSMISGGMSSAAMIAARSAMLIMPATNIASQQSGNKRSKKKSDEYARQRAARFGNYLDEQRTRIMSVANQQRKIILDENPSPEECFNITCNLKRNLWERTAADRDFLDVRLGMGYENLCVEVKDRGEAYGIEMEDDDEKEFAAMLVEESKIVDNIPVRVSLRENQTVGVIGDRDKVIRQVKNMIIELTTFHCSSDVRIVGIFDEKERPQWESLKWLPHIWDDNKQVRFLAFDKESSHGLCEAFNDMLKVRRREIGDRQTSKPTLPNPYYIFILGSKDYLADEEIMKNLLLNRPEMGVTSLFLFDDIYNLPNECNYIIETGRYPVAYYRNKIDSKFIFTEDKFADSKFDVFVRKMASIELKGFATQAEIPNSVTFLEGFNVKRIEELQILNRWKNSKPYDSLAAQIGIMAGGKTFSLDIHDQKHGPHGLVAGTTGSGKSELIQTWILSMCVNFHPYDVSFVLIDYKGGGMANLLEPLPHVVGKITNIGSNIKRSLVSLTSEMHRREGIFAEYGVNHINKYQKLFKTGQAKEPMPHLVIVSDEFAELKKEEPDFMEGLKTAARVGRTLGIHLILATQKPSGVVDDQIWANSHFKLCLKVQDAGDSREMIKKPDAAMITQAGRCYVQVGMDEIFELFQSYWSGAKYYTEKSNFDDMGNQISIVEYNGNRIKSIAKKDKSQKAATDEITAIVDYISELVKINNISPVAGPWLPELEESFLLDKVIDGGYEDKQWGESPDWLKVPVGIFDMPAQQSQGVMNLDFSADGHYGIYGAPSTGKTTFLKTTLLSLCRNYTPQDINIYILDCGGWSLSTFSDMPHVGGIALDTQEEKFVKFGQLIMDEIETRKREFLKYAVSSLTAYRQAVKKMPAIIIAIDNIVPIFDLYPDMEDIFIKISREGATYGIYMIYTANSTSGIRFKVIQNIKGAVAFELTDKGDYTSIIGRLDGMSLPNISGRAFFKGNPPLEFQTAMFINGINDMERSDNIKALSAEMAESWSGELPRAIPVMPENVATVSLLKYYQQRNVLPLGLDFENVSITYADLRKFYSLVISGAIGSGKSALLTDIIAMISSVENNQIFVFDSSKSSLAAVSDKVYSYSKSDSPEKMKAAVDEIIGELNKRKTAQNQARADLGESFDEIEYIKDTPQICVFIDDLNDFIENVENETKNGMERIVRLAENLGVIVFASCRLADLSRLNEIETLTRAMVSYQNGVGLGATAGTYSFFNCDLKYNEKEVDCGDGNAWRFFNGSCRKIKIMS